MRRGGEFIFRIGDDQVPVHERSDRYRVNSILKRQYSDVFTITPW